MCGLVGVIGTLNNKEKTALKWLLHFDVIRGPHSTGIATVGLNDKRPNDYTVMKALGFPEDLYKAYPAEFDEGKLKDWGADVIIGHNRWATQGGISVETAHPFAFEHVIGAHNGTVKQSSLADFEGFLDHVVDSQIIFSQLNYDNNLQTVWDKADGAMALVWWDKRDNLLHIARNDERELFYCYTKDKKCVFWASERWMLSVALAKCGIEHDVITPITPNKHYTFNPKWLEVTHHEGDLVPYVKPSAFNWAAYDDDDYNYYNMGYSRDQQKPNKKTLRINEYNNEGPNDWNGKFFGFFDEDTEICVGTAGVKQQEYYDFIMERVAEGKPFFSYSENHSYKLNGTLFVHASCIDHEPNLKVIIKDEGVDEDRPLDFDGDIITKRRFKLITKEGCACCKKVPHWKQAKEILWVSSEDFVCSECKESELVRDWLHIEQAKKEATNG